MKCWVPHTAVVLNLPGTIKAKFLSFNIIDSNTTDIFWILFPPHLIPSLGGPKMVIKSG